MKSRFASALILSIAITAATAAAQELKLAVADSLNAPATFVTTEAVTYDSSYIYAASSEGNLYVKSRNKTGFPLVSNIQVGLEPLRSVRVDGNCHTVYVTGN